MTEALKVLNDAGYRRYECAGNRKTAFLKVLALVFMVIDHTGVIFFPGVIEWRVIGRLAFPLYAWCLVVGMGYTRSPALYSLRLLSVAVASQFFYMKALNHQWYEFSVILTLLLGQLAIYGMQRKWMMSELWAPVLAIAVALVLKMDYGYKGVLLIILLYLARKSRSAVAALMIAFCLFWGEGTIAVNKLFSVDLTPLKTLTQYAGTLYTPMVRIQNLAVFSLVFILYPIGWEYRHPTWLSYLAYPGHHLILWLFRMAMAG